MTHTPMNRPLRILTLVVTSLMVSAPALLAQTEEGWVSYLWPRPGDQRASRKEAYVRKVSSGGRELVVGAGIYLSD